MKVLITDDSAEKAALIENYLATEFGSGASFTTVGSLTEYVTARLRENFDIEIIDLQIPLVPGDTARDCTAELCGNIRHYEGRSTKIALTQFAELLEPQRDKFRELGITLLHYTVLSDDWKEALRRIVASRNSKPNFDFVIVCALEEERDGFAKTQITLEGQAAFMGFDVQFAKLGDLSGALVCLPQMGLVTSASICARLLEVFNVGTLAMTGICGGSSRNTALGVVLVADPCWEHQSGKLTPAGFEIAPYQIPLEESVRLAAAEVCRNLDVKRQLVEVLDIGRSDCAAIGPFISGSAVIADGEKMSEIVAQQHRKTAGLDMEIYGLYRAAKLASRPPKFFACKTVVDLADKNKSDEIHEQGCHASALLALEIILRLNTG